MRAGLCLPRCEITSAAGREEAERISVEERKRRRRQGGAGERESQRLMRDSRVSHSTQARERQPNEEGAGKGGGGVGWRGDVLQSNWNWIKMHTETKR